MIHSFTGDEQKYWPGSRPSLGCACGYGSSCADMAVMCNCDMNDATSRTDVGFIDEPKKLPLTAVQTTSTTGTSDVNIVVHPVEVTCIL